MIRRLYPNGKRKAFNVTYDDGVLQDVRFVELLNQYQLKGTFNLNSAMLESEFSWTHETGAVVKRLSSAAAAHLYLGHEVASHTLTHPYMDHLTKEEIMHELAQDKANLGQLFGREIRGFAVPFEYYSELIKRCVEECGFEYARISEESYSFTPPSDYYHWCATVFHCHDALENLTQQFIETDEELALFQIVGHSYDLDIENRWALMEQIFQRIHQQEDVLPMTTIDVVDYLKAMRQAVITHDAIINRSSRSLWFAIHGAICEVKPGMQLAI